MGDTETPAGPSQDERQPNDRQQTTGGGGQRHERGERDRERGGRRRHQPQQQQQQPRRPETSINIDELRNLFELITAHGFTEFELEREGFRISVGRRQQTSERPAESVGATMQAQLQSPQPAVGGQTSAAPSANTTATQSAPAAIVPSHPGAQAEAAAAADEALQIIHSPIVGTFYRSPSPTAEPFVRMGSFVTADSVVCIIEAMKLMNEIQAELSGEIIKIYVENGQPVEYGQPLFGVKK